VPARRLALLVATYSYQDAGLRQLAAPGHDAEALAEVLRDPEIANFDVIILINEPHYVVRNAIGEFYPNRRRDDLTLLYFTGHGLKDDQGRLYLAMTNTKRDDLLFTALSAQQIDEAMESCASRQKVLVLDCCYSGAFPQIVFPKLTAASILWKNFRARGEWCSPLPTPPSILSKETTSQEKECGRSSLVPWCGGNYRRSRSRQRR
jgi:uncharacterized caspase-like protein